MAKPKKMPKNVRSQGGDLASRIGPRVEQAREMAGPMIAEAREKAGPVLLEAREKAGPVIAEAREKAGPMLAEARDRLGERLTKDVLPTLSAAVAAADDATEDIREEARRRGLAAAAALRGEVEPPKRTHRVRNLLILVGLGGIIAAVAKALSDRQASTAWQSSYSPPPAPSPRPTQASGDDEAGATPDVAASDANATPHTVSTPDQPATETDLSKNE